MTLAPWNQKQTSLQTSNASALHNSITESSKKVHTYTSNNLTSGIFSLNATGSQDEKFSSTLQNRAILYTSKPVSLPLNPNATVEQQKEFPSNILLRLPCKIQSEAHHVASTSNDQQVTFIQKGPKVVAEKISPSPHTFQSISNIQQMQRSQSSNDLTVSRTQGLQNIQITRSQSMENSIKSFQSYIGKNNVVNVAQMKLNRNQPIQIAGNLNSRMPRPNLKIDSMKMPPPQSRQQVFPSYAQSTTTQLPNSSQSQSVIVGSVRNQNYSSNTQNQVQRNQNSSLYFQTVTPMNQNFLNEHILKETQLTAKPDKYAEHFDSNSNQDTHQTLCQYLQATAKTQVMAQSHQNVVQQVATTKQNSMTNNNFSMRSNNQALPRNFPNQFDHIAQTNMTVEKNPYSFIQSNQNSMWNPSKTIQNSEQSSMEHEKNHQDVQNENKEELTLQKHLATVHNNEFKTNNKTLLNDQEMPQLNPESSDIIEQSDIRSTNEKTPNDQQDWREHTRKFL